MLSSFVAQALEFSFPVIRIIFLGLLETFFSNFRFKFKYLQEEHFFFLFDMVKNQAGDFLLLFMHISLSKFTIVD